MDIQTCSNLQKLIDENPNIQIIEIWDKVLYIRMKKGRNTFHSKKNITTMNSGIYLNLLNFNNDYKQLQRQFHPDINSKYSEISKGINQWKQLLSECHHREFNRTEFDILISSFTPDTCIFSASKSIGIILAEATGFCYGSQSLEAEIARRAESKRWWKIWHLRRRGRDENGNKLPKPDAGDIPPF